jgi:hypothetical protein
MNCRNWYYGVILDESNGKSLCNLIRMTLVKIIDLFCFIDLGDIMIFKGKKTFRINGNKFRKFLEREKLGTSYFDWMKVGNVSGREFGKVIT